MKKNGFTLIELIISIALVGIILASMIGTLISLKDTYGVINDDVEARTYSALISKVINDHLMKNNGIKSYYCEDNICSITLGNNKDMVLKIDKTDVKLSDIKDSTTGNKIGTATEQVTTVKYYEVNGNYSYYKTIKHYDKKYDNNDDSIELGYKFEKITEQSHAYDSKKDPGLKDYIVNITIEMNNPKYNIELYATSLVEEDEIEHKYRLYTLTYNSNGGSSCDSETKTVRDREKWGSLCIPRRPRYGFKGWFIQPSGVNVPEVTSETIAIEDITVYAHWDSTKYSCEAGTYLKAGETACSDCLSDHYCPGITNVYFDKFNDQGITPCLTGYHSEPKSTSSAACKIACEENNYVKNANDSSCTACAQGYEKGSHEVIQGNTSNCTIGTPTKPTISGGGTKIYGSGDFTLTCSTPSAYASGTNVYYQFGYASNTTNELDNWTTASTTNTLIVNKTAYFGNRYYACKVYASGSGTSSAVESDRTLVRFNNAKVTFDATTNGGEIDGTESLYTRTGTTGLYTGIRNSTAATIPKANKTGYTWNGWFTSSSGGNKVYNDTPTLQASVSGYTDSSSKWTIIENKTLYGQYSAKQFTVSFDCNGGSGSPSNQTATYDSPFTLTSSTCSTAKTGHTQSGWNEKADGTGTNWTTSNTNNWTWNYTNNVTLYAKWNIRSYTLTVNAGDGTIPTTSGWTLGSESKTATKSINYDDTYGTLPTPTRSNYTFDGWYTSASGGTKVTSLTKMGSSNTTIYAHWTINEIIPSCTLTVSTSGVTINAVNAAQFGMAISSTPTYNSTTSLALSANTFYGFVKSSTNHTASCSVTLRNATAKYSCVGSNAYLTYSGTCACTKYFACVGGNCPSPSTNTYDCGGYSSCSSRCSAEGRSVGVMLGVSNTCTLVEGKGKHCNGSTSNYLCPNSGCYGNDSKCHLYSMTSCPTGYNISGTDYTCSSGTKVGAYCY
ncbi:MAG: InlB B-repeat-containing protein [Bacilli bacterium]|nr:InlB B-repeat-containing protein [Bacilli bacterium]